MTYLSPLPHVPPPLTFLFSLPFVFTPHSVQPLPFDHTLKSHLHHQPEPTFLPLREEAGSVASRNTSIPEAAASALVVASQVKQETTAIATSHPPAAQAAAPPPPQPPQSFQSANTAPHHRHHQGSVPPPPPPPPGTTNNTTSTTATTVIVRSPETWQVCEQFALCSLLLLLLLR